MNYINECKTIVYFCWDWLGENSDQFISLSAIFTAFSVFKRFVLDERTRFNVSLYFPDGKAQSLPNVEILNRSYFDIEVKEISIKLKRRGGLVGQPMPFNPGYFDKSKATIEKKRVKSFIIPGGDDAKKHLLPWIDQFEDLRFFARVETVDGKIRRSKPIPRDLPKEERESLRKYVEGRPGWKLQD